jgi:hypothetical protein
VSSILNCELHQICDTLCLLIELGKIYCFSRDSLQRGSFHVFTLCSMMHCLAEKSGVLTRLLLILEVENKSIFLPGLILKEESLLFYYLFTHSSHETPFVKVWNGRSGVQRGCQKNLNCDLRNNFCYSFQ